MKCFLIAHGENMERRTVARLVECSQFDDKERETWEELRWWSARLGKRQAWTLEDGDDVAELFGRREERKRGWCGDVVRIMAEADVNGSDAETWTALVEVAKADGYTDEDIEGEEA